MLLVSNVHIPLRIDLGLGQVFETTVWCWSHIYFCDRLLCFSPLPCPSREGHAAGDPRSWANPKIKAAGVGCGGGNTERRSFGSSLLTLDQHQGGPLSPSSVVPRLEGSRLLQPTTTQAFQRAGNRFVFCYPFGSPPTWTATKIF